MLPDTLLAFAEANGIDLNPLIHDADLGMIVRLGATLDDRLTDTIAAHSQALGPPVAKSAFWPGGRFEAMAAKIAEANRRGLLTTTAHRDADLLRKIRNEVSHDPAAVHLGSHAFVNHVRRLSTYSSNKQMRQAIKAAFDGALLCLHFKKQRIQTGEPHHLRILYFGA